MEMTVTFCEWLVKSLKKQTTLCEDIFSEEAAFLIRVGVHEKEIKFTGYETIHKLHCMSSIVSPPK